MIAAPVSSKAIATQAEFVGRVTAIDRVDLQARVPGFLKEWHFTEGQPVSVGDALFQIEPEQYQAVGPAPGRPGDGGGQTRRTRWPNTNGDRNY